MKIILHFLLYMLLTTLVCEAQSKTAEKLPAIQSSFIWSTSGSSGKQEWVAFRKSFNLDETSRPATLKLFADSRYMLWINGQYVLRGPCRFNPRRPEFDVVDVRKFLKKGKNTISVLAHNYGNLVNGHIMKHVPGLTSKLEIGDKQILRTDATWRCSNKTRYQLSPESWNTVPDVIDARVDNCEWILTDFDDSAWPFAMPVNGQQWGKMFPRALPLARETELSALRLLPSGKLLNASLPIELNAGDTILVDFGRMAMAYTAMELDCSEGSNLTMKYALRYKNGQPGEMYGDGNRYTAREGHQSFMTTDQWGSHYMRVKCETGHVKIESIKIVDRSYPFDRIGKFSCNDEILTKLWEMAQNTIEVTSDDGYGSDARERNEWIQDAGKASFSTTRVGSSGPGKDGKPVYSDPRLLKNMLRHSSLCQLPDGQLPATFPTDRGPEDCHYIIEDYSCQWFEGLKTYYDVTGDKEFVREMWLTLVAQINWFLSHRTKRGLLLAREYTSFDNPFAYTTCEGATINAFFYEAIKASEELARVLGETKKSVEFKLAADELKTAYNKQFWNEKEQVYNSAILNDKVYAPTVHAQLIALHYDLVPKTQKASVQKWFHENYRNPGMRHYCSNSEYEKMVNQKSGIDMPVVYYWVLHQLYNLDTDEVDHEAIQEIRRRWSSMVKFQEDAGTLCESFTDEKGEGATESCHNYGAVPAYFLSSYVLGIRMDGPVWNKQLIIEPRLGDLKFAEGTVVTALGAVPVSWNIRDNGKSLSYNFIIPKGIQATVRLPRLSDKQSLIMNGEFLIKNGVPHKDVKEEGRWIVIRSVSGTCSGKLSGI